MSKISSVSSYHKGFVLLSCSHIPEDQHLLLSSHWCPDSPHLHSGTQLLQPEDWASTLQPPESHLSLRRERSAALEVLYVCPASPPRSMFSQSSSQATSPTLQPLHNKDLGSTCFTLSTKFFGWYLKLCCVPKTIHCFILSYFLIYANLKSLVSMNRWRLVSNL